jgi:hypothetical protein
MSLATLPQAASGDGWDDFVAFAAITEGFDRTDLPEQGQPAREHRPHRSVERRAAIDKSLREWR